MKCPRRDENSGPWALPEEDSWLDGVCSYCGSLEPAFVIDAIIHGCEVVPTDKNYKIYLKDKKFYIQHFDRDQAIKFTELYNDGKMQVGYPNYFYKKLYFWS